MTRVSVTSAGAVFWVCPLTRNFFVVKLTLHKDAAVADDLTCNAETVGAYVA